MGLKNVDDQERDLAAVLVVELVEGRNLPPERRSSVAAEHQHDRLFRGQSRQLDRLGFVELHQREVRGQIAWMQLTGAGVHPHSFEGSQQKNCRDRHSGHDAAKGFRRLVHGPPHGTDEADVYDDNDH